ncbi:retrovirus-related pol polyprotein from transposon TNT 1-94 [Tanacetum coccineum]
MSAIEEMSSQCNKVQQENLLINETLTAEIERYKEQVKLFEQRQKFDLNDREKYIDGQLRKVIVDKNVNFTDFEKQIHSLKLQLNETVESHKTLSTIVECLKKESKQKEDKYLDEFIDLQKKNKALDNVVYKMGQKVPALYNGHTIVKTHDALSVTDTKETLELVEEKHAFWLPISQPVSKKPPVPSEPVLKKEIPHELPPISLVKDSFHKMKEHANKFDETITFHTKITSNRIGSWGVKHIKGAFEKDVNPFAQTLKEYFHMFEHGLYKELKEMKAVFNQIETEVAKCSVDKKYFEIEKKEISLDNDRLLEHIICQDVMNIVMHADFIPDNVLPANNKFHICVNSLATLTNYAQIEQDYIDEYSENLMLKAELAKKEHMVEKDFFDEVILRCSRLENRAILEFFKINEWQAKLDTKDVLIANLRKHIKSLKGKNVVEKVATPNNAKVITPEMFKLDLEPLAPRVLNNKDAYIDYIKHSREHADTLQEIVKHARALRPLDSDLDSALSDARVKSKFVKSRLAKSKKKKMWKPTSKVYTNVGYSWKPTGRIFTIDGNTCPLTRIISNHGKGRTLHKPKADDTNQEKLYLLHMDLCGPMRVESINGKKYILVIIDDYSRFTWVKFLKSKDETLKAASRSGLAPRARYDMLSSFLLSQEFSKGVVDPTLFTRKAGRDILLVQIYVDDIIFASTNPAMCDEFAKIMSSKFNMSMMGKMSFFLRLQIFQSLRGIFINQSNYALEIIKKYGMQSSDPVDTPMVDKNKLDEDLQGKPIDPTHYRGMIGSLRYLTSTRPNLVFVVCMCVWYQAKPTEKHLHHMQMQTTPGVKILDATHLEVHNSWGINLSSGHPRSKRALLSLIPLYCNNKSALALCCNNVQHSRSKHIDVRYHFIKEQVEWNGGTLLRQNRISASRHLHQSFASRKIQLLDRKAWNEKHVTRNSEKSG